MLLRSARLADGSTVDVRVDGELIAAVEPGRLEARPDEEVVDLAGKLLVRAFAEPHAHLDKAFLAERIDNPTGDLMGAITAMRANRHRITLDDTIERAERAVRLLAANGATTVRSHADTTRESGLMSVEALIEVRRRVAGICDLQVVALISWPVVGDEGAESRALLRDALDAGADVVGGAPHLEGEAAHEANDVLLGIAAEYGRDVDLHTDETLDPGACGLADLAQRVIATGFPHRVTASHCVSLSMQPLERQFEVARLVAQAGISVVALPQTNLFLQGREHQYAMPRALTAVKSLRDAGANVCAGADNLQDPFNPMGKADPLETGALMVMAAHLSPEDALHAVSGGVHRAMRSVAEEITVGARADLVALDARTVREALAFQPPGRVVIHRGRLLTSRAS
jgi:cytosine deaminase